MGIYRLALSLLVLIGHLGYNFYGKGLGVISVISFLVISGYVMTALIKNHYAEPNKIFLFYSDRALRLFPQFIFYMVLTIILAIWLRPESVYLTNLSVERLILNITMLPLNFALYFPESLLMPQAWSLGLELQFYLIFPVLIYYNLRKVAFVLSIFFFFAPYFGLLPSDMWSYRMLPGTLFMFLFGSYLYEGFGRGFFIAGYVAVIMMFVGTLTVPEFHGSFNFEILLGIIVGVPIVWLLSKRSFGRVEQIAGNLSYGVFLNHFFIIWAFQCAGIEKSASYYVVAVILVSLVLAYMSYELIERSAISLRKSMRAANVKDFSATA